MAWQWLTSPPTAPPGAALVPHPFLHPQNAMGIPNVAPHGIAMYVAVGSFSRVLEPFFD